MAEFNSPLYTSEAGTAGSSAAVGYPQARDSAGKLRIKTIPYVTDGTETTGDTINLGKLKVGAKVIPSLCRVVSEAAFDIDDLNIGTPLNPNAFADAMDTTDAELDQPFRGGDDRLGPVSIVSGDEDIVATLVSATTTTAGELVLFLVAYVDE